MLHFPAPRAEPCWGEGCLCGKLKNRPISISFSLRKKGTKIICRSVEQGSVRAGSPCSCVPGFAGAPDSVVLLLWLWVLEAWSWQAALCKPRPSHFGVWIIESCTRVPSSRQTEILMFPGSVTVPGRSTGMGRGEVMGLERKVKERWSRNTQARSHGKSVTTVLQSNAEPGP